MAAADFTLFRGMMLFQGFLSVEDSKRFDSACRRILFDRWRKRIDDLYRGSVSFEKMLLHAIVSDIIEKYLDPEEKDLCKNIRLNFERFRRFVHSADSEIDICATVGESLFCNAVEMARNHLKISSKMETFVLSSIVDRHHVYRYNQHLGRNIHKVTHAIRLKFWRALLESIPNK